jgi:hypothetical protein
MSYDIEKKLERVLQTIPDQEVTKALGYLSAEWASSLKDEELSETSLKNRFQCIAAIQAGILDGLPEDDSDVPIPIDENDFLDEIKLIIRISNSLQHSEAYIQFWNLVRVYSVAKLMQNGQYLNYIDNWVDPAKIDSAFLEVGPNLCYQIARNLDAVDLMNREISDTLSAVSEAQGLDISFRRARTQYYYRPSRQYWNTTENQSAVIVSCGFFSNDLFDQFSPAIIGVNVHPDANFSNPFEVSDTLLHEIVHSGGSQIAQTVLSKTINEAHPFYYDGLLELERERYKATISARILNGYLNQFHEKLAFFQGNEFGRTLEKDNAARLAFKM